MLHVYNVLECPVEPEFSSLSTCFLKRDATEAREDSLSVALGNKVREGGAHHQFSSMPYLRGVNLDKSQDKYNQYFL